MTQFSNGKLAEFFTTIADLLEIKGEVIFKVLAYRKAADSLNSLNRSIYDYWREKKVNEIPGVGKAIAEKIDELLTTGKLGFYEKLIQEVPLSLEDVLKVPDVGPKKVALFWKQAGITTVTELEAAARSGKLRSLPGMGEKSETKILAGIESLRRRSGRVGLGKAWVLVEELLPYLRAAAGVVSVEAAGSFRRRKATIGDLDLIAAAVDSRSVMEAFINHPDVERIVGNGDTKSSVEFQNGMRAQLWVLPPDRFGTAWQYATGSKDHNVRLRELALKQGLSLSEHALTRADGSEILCAQEEEVYRNLGLPWIPPEMREDRGEVQAALNGTLPVGVKLSDLKAELHTHTTWSDGSTSIREMAEAAIQRGKKVLAITDHSSGLGIVGGMTPEDVRRQRLEIRAVQAELGDRLTLLQGAEVEIKADGALEYSDEVLAELDIVIASLHSSLRQPREKITQRLLNAIRNPQVDIIGHPTGRLLPDREGADLDMEAVLQAAKEAGLALEINAHPSRLDLEDIYCQRAVELGIPLAINTDAHHAADLDLAHFGVSNAVRGWVTKESVLNTWEVDKLVGWLKGR